ncbi:hypothetical protein C0992_004601 [Termitomyces sp. T32_za158]|nr:hypothetical protein C0992_004601 [Termitomyces sp. T32_za158]
MASPRENNCLLLVYGECGQYVTEEEFNEWYDNEHVPARLALSDFSTAARYKAADGKSPSWLAIYDATTTDVLQSGVYKALFANASANEKSIISRIAVLHRAVYHLDLTVENPIIGTNSLPARVVLVVGDQDNNSHVGKEEVERWYLNEHLPLLSKVPGFIRSRRYKLVSDVELAGKADPTSPIISFPKLTLYDLENASFLNEPAYREAISMPWALKMMPQAATSEIRSFSLYKGFAK